MSTDIALRTTIGEIEGHRNRALEMFGEAFDTLHEACAVAQKAAPRENLYLFDERAVADLVPRYSRGDRAAFIASVTKKVDAGVWTFLLDHMGLEKLMDAQAREEFRKTLSTDPPPATAENCFATMSALVEDSGLIFRRGLSNAFSRLDRRFRSHDGFKIGARVILKYALGSWGSWTRGTDETLRDIERVFTVLDGKPHVDRYAGICGLIDEEKRKGRGLTITPGLVEGEYFRARWFKNGNMHLWFTRDDLLREVNKLLAEYYGEALGAGSDVAEKKHDAKRTPAKHFGFFPSPAAVVDRVMDQGYVGKGMTVLEPSAGEGAIALAAKANGAKVTCIEIQSALVAKLRASGLKDVREEDFLSLDPRLTKERFDRVLMNPPFDSGRDIDHVTHALGFLAPGGRLASVMSAGVEFREDAKATAFRDLVERRKGKFFDLPPGSFKDAGTMVNTVIVFIPG